MKRLVPQKELAEILGLSARQIRNLEQSGMPKESKGYPIPAAVRWYVEHKVAEVEDRLQSEETEADERLKDIRASLLELELEEKRGRLMTVEEYDLVVEGAFQRVRARLLSLAPRAAPAVVGVTTAAEAQKIIGDLVREAMDELYRGDDVPAAAPEPEEAA